MKKGKFIIVLFLIFSSLLNAQVDYKDSWVACTMGAAYKGVIGIEGNVGLDATFAKFNDGGIRLSIYGEAGTGPAGMGFGWLHSYTSLVKLTLIDFNSGFGVSYGYGFEQSTYITQEISDTWGGWKTHRLGVVADENLEIYMNFNMDNSDDFWKIMTLEIGVIGKLGLF